MTQDTPSTARKSPYKTPENAPEKATDKIGAKAQAVGLKGKLLIASPTLDDPTFEKAVVFVCEHDVEGAMGFVINKPSEDISLSDMLEQLEIEDSAGMTQTLLDSPDADTVRFGGPCRPGHGFVVFPTDESRFDPEVGGVELIDEKRSFSNDIEFLRKIAAGDGPESYLILLGFAGWAAGQLEQELQDNSWLHIDADEALLYEPNTDTIWDKAINKLGFDPAHLSLSAGRA